MKAVLISIQPKWCELIASGKKIVEVRKAKPKLETPFKVYIYCTADRRKHIADTYVPQTPLFVKNGKVKSSIGREDGLPWKLGNGKVIGEFVCDEIDKYTKAFFDEQEERDTYDIARFIYHSRIKYDDLCAYVGLGDFYAWHISDLVIYDKPKNIGDFVKYDSCPFLGKEGCTYEFHCFRAGQIKRCGEFLTKPPQSWFYVEKIKE